MTTQRGPRDRTRPAVLAIGVIPLLFAALGAGLAIPDLGGYGPTGVVFVVIAEAIVLSLTLVGGFVAWRVPRNPVGWLLEVAGASAALAVFGGMYSAYVHPAGTSLPLVVPIAWLANWAIDPAIAILIVFIPMLFPTGRFLGHRWKALGIVGVALAALGIVGTAFAPGPLAQAAPSIENPLGLAGAGNLLSVLTTASNAALPFVAVPAVLSVFVRYRRAGRVERLQLKWFGLVAGIAAVAFLVSLPNAGPVSDVAWMVALATLPAIPVAIGIAILRYRLWDIDRIVSRTVTYAVISGLLGATFAGLVLVLDTTLAPLASGDSLAIAGSTLAVAALFQPLRRRVQRFVDRRFDRARYDAERTAAALASRLRDETDVAAIRTSVLTAIDNSLRPSQAGLWVRGER